VLEAGGFDGVLEGAAEFLAVVEGAAGAGGFVALVEADEEVVFEDWHRGLDAGLGAAMREAGCGSGTEGASVREYRIWHLMI
jgi:beta-phosphoglucomutase-like phosphatase (HAD superfamily)